jgi:hypothetical protein
MWYYIFDKKKFGPVDEKKLFDLYDIRVINSQTMVLQEGTSEWIRLEATSLRREFQKVKGKPEKLKETLTLTFVLTLFSIAGFFFQSLLIPYRISASIKVQNLLTSGLCLLWIPAALGDILQFVLLYRLWKAIQNENSRTTPGKAVGYLFIPIFNFYWRFRAYWGFSKQANEYIERLRIKKHNDKFHTSKEWLSLLYSLYNSVFIVISFIVYRSVYLENLSPIGITPVSSTIQYFAVMKPALIIQSIYLLVNYIIWYAMSYDLYLTADSILKAEENQ